MFIVHLMVNICLCIWTLSSWQYLSFFFLLLHELGPYSVFPNASACIELKKEFSHVVKCHKRISVKDTTAQENKASHCVTGKCTVLCVRCIRVFTHIGLRWFIWISTDGCPIVSRDRVLGGEATSARRAPIGTPRVGVPQAWVRANNGQISGRGRVETLSATHCC